MALQASGAISLDDIRTEFGGDAPHAISEYYRDGTYVPGNNASIPTSGTIAFDDFYGGTAATVLTISTNTSEYNILTAAVAASFNNAVGGVIIVNINSGVTVSGSTTYAMRTGALHNSTILTINNSGDIDGFTGAAGGAGAAGAAGGDAIYIEALTGGTGSLTVNNLSGAKLRGGGGGGGGYGRRSTWYDDGKGGSGCTSPTHNGSAGAAGGFGAAGAAGSYGGGSSNCIVNSPGAGGAAGYAMRKNGRTVTYNDSGTTNGTVG